MNPDSGSSYGYGTYRPRILIDPLEQPVALWLQGIQASSQVEINGVDKYGGGRERILAQNRLVHRFPL
ncbi:hypothetical protein WJ0W_006854 [Paenibacillus melissococcoides]|uniref:Uncharacterized protein n=1 Tax=Paenibacillus melissococcoides TaxID=2912268 RepID=A0ABM9GBZ2_9BACL|nr:MULTISPECIES: hypothetical protein [Paenibacillus]MEB9895167.1 hypothetical protein [Bacillus cereus]CAH8249670.1 hypothetical protein WJ0W_006854 [Paenibacillus melissococcoides]CAH8721501.1 hypothetical protein WDD9_006324 [Paenibacillus melissococcoides]CAH8721718.1 hypothetical protein HTL2_006502 [Paenibacillus melissococcoides]GIO82552.1 hypothetical protein J6TS7_61620 [Paenibacillus dendritiformis]